MSKKAAPQRFAGELQHLMWDMRKVDVEGSRYGLRPLSRRETSRNLKPAPERAQPLPEGGARAETLESN